MAAIEILKVSKLLPFLTDDLYARYTVHELDDLKDPSALSRVTMRSESTSALGQPKDTKPIFAATTTLYRSCLSEV